jgi:hypothetical protein
MAAETFFFFALGLGNADQGRANEQSIVSGAARRRPLGTNNQKMMRRVVMVIPA